MTPDFLNDPLWYKDAVIYELHVRSFYDANNDGYGEFEGLRQKLPYLASLGVNTLWLLPFLESPLRDDGYDTADYLKVLPVHGTMDDFKTFLSEAHELGMRVITELVLNHTSDQHPWFQEARDPRSPKHDWYVWSDDTDLYQDARIIFTDTEVSNWAWDRKAKRYYWHRFFSHQPDLNYDNPEVREVMKEVLFFWLDMGVDGLRLDAVPYLYEREGTSCENLPETIDYIRELRAAIEERYGPGKVLLAEANQWPEDTLPYFADGEGVQMAFNFPIMPRMYMALQRENRRPLVEMLELTKDIPEDAQWAIFLRNHDELTLEMVTDEERDYMWNEYAADPRFRINVGIRRRLAPLLGSDRRRIELMNALLLSLKGSPIIYYGDEIGMGDDPFLGDRNGVRTPMQWSPDKNGGFSRAPHHRLFMPPIDRGPYSHEFVNVEDAEQNPSSLLHFMQRLLGLRNQHTHVFGRGDFEVLPVENQSVFAFLRTYEDDQILVVANLSRYAQSLHVPSHEALNGCVPVELFSQSAFPAFDDEPYHIILGPYGFYWFGLKSERHVQDEVARRGEPGLQDGTTLGDLPVIEVAEGLQNLLVKTLARGHEPERLEARLNDFIKAQPWFLGDPDAVERVLLEDAVRIQAEPRLIYLTVLGVPGEEHTERYVMPLMLAEGEEAQAVLDEHPDVALAWVDSPYGRHLLHDATVSPDFWPAFFAWWTSGSKERSLQGLYMTEVSSAVRQMKAEETRPIRRKQRNVLAMLGEQVFAKLYRRIEQGTHPEVELLTHLTQTGFAFVPRLEGTLSFTRAEREYTLGILTEAVPVETDGWKYAQEMTTRFLDRVEATPKPRQQEIAMNGETPVWLTEVAQEMLAFARLLGIRTAELHCALASAEDPDLRLVEDTPEEADAFVQRVRREAVQTRRMLVESTEQLEGVPQPALWEHAFQQLETLASLPVRRPKIRVHGNYHLGQVIRSDGELYILDFEGEPGRSMTERRRRDYALRDVAGMLRSFEYAALVAWRQHSNDPDVRATWVQPLVHHCAETFLHSYLDTAGDDDFLLPGRYRMLMLWAYLLDRAAYEVRFEHAHRPDWTWLPLSGLRRLLERARDGERLVLAEDE